MIASAAVGTDYRIVQATMRDVHAIRRLEQLIFPLDAYTYLSLTTLLMWPGGANFKAVDASGTLVGFVAGSPNWGTHVDWIVTLGRPDVVASCDKDFAAWKQCRGMEVPPDRQTRRASPCVGGGVVAGEGHLQ